MTDTTTKPVVVGVDGSRPATGAARWAAAVADKFAAPVQIVHGLPDAGHLLTDAAAAIRAAAITAQRESAATILKFAEEDLHARFPDLAITTARCDMPADHVLVDLGRHALMVVLGSDDILPAAAMLIGSTTLAVVARSAAPVVAWRGEVESPTDQPIVLGVDGDKTPAAAFGAAFEFADRFGVPVKAVTAWRPLHSPAELMVPGLVDWDALEALQWQNLLNVVEPWTELFPDVDVNYFLEQEGASKALLRHVDDSQLVVVGRRRNLLAGAVLGSTSLNLLHHCPVPVMLCHMRSHS